MEKLASQILITVAMLVVHAELTGLSGPQKHALVKQGILSLIAAHGLGQFVTVFEPFLDGMISTEVKRRHQRKDFPFAADADPGIIGVLKFHEVIQMVIELNARQAEQNA